MRYPVLREDFFFQSRRRHDESTTRRSGIVLAGNRPAAGGERLERCRFLSAGIDLDVQSLWLAAELRGREADQRPKSRRTDRVDVGAVSAAQLLPVRIESPGRSPHVRVLLSHGVSLDVSPGSDASTLTMVLCALREVQLC